MKWLRRRAILSLVLVVLAVATTAHAVTPIAGIADAAHRALSGDDKTRRNATQWLLQNGDQGSVAVLIQLLRWLPDDENEIVARLQAVSGARPGQHWFDWMVWQRAHPEITPFAGYDEFLSAMLAGIDPRFQRFIHAGVPHEIRLEEITWGGVAVDGIPALDNPEMIAAGEARYLDPTDLVFGVEINGDARAYPLRIADWHEMVNDVVGGVPVSLAYCTLCGAGILFKGGVAGRPEPLTFGSSGLLYRSNKLMYDRQTNSLWNQFTGRPVVGALTNSGIALEVLPLALTSWSQWRSRHPDTRVLSLATGFKRDYRPGAAYGDYFASSELMFPALVTDRRLAAKDLIFGLRLPGGVKAWALADFAGGAIVNDRVGLADVVLIGEADGRGVRAYAAHGHRFTRGTDTAVLIAEGKPWRIEEEALIGPEGEHLARLPGHIAYWFAWAGYFENAELGGGAGP